MPDPAQPNTAAQGDRDRELATTWAGSAAANGPLQTGRYSSVTPDNPAVPGALTFTGLAEPNVPLNFFIYNKRLQVYDPLLSVVPDSQGRWSFDTAAMPLAPSLQTIVGISSQPETGRSSPPGVVGVNIGTTGDDFIETGFDNKHVFGGTGVDTVVLGRTFDSLTTLRYGDTFHFYITDDLFPPFPSGKFSADVRSFSGATIYGFEKVANNNFGVKTIQYNPLVDFIYYNFTYGDLKPMDVDVRIHYDTFGRFEARNPNAFFDTTAYLNFNKDVKAAGINPLDHFDAVGWKEGRSPSAAFDSPLYLLFNPDVAASGMDPLRHYLLYGRYENRKSSPVVDTTKVVDAFDPTYYLLSNPRRGCQRAGCPPALRPVRLEGVPQPQRVLRHALLPGPAPGGARGRPQPAGPLQHRGLAERAGPLATVRHVEISRRVSGREGGRDQPVAGIPPDRHPGRPFGLRRP